MSSKYNAASKAASLAQKSANVTYKEVDAPAHSQDYITSFKANASPTVKMANIFIMDVFPNMVPILLYIIFQCVTHSSKIDDRAHAKVTVPVMIAYCLTLVYGYILLSDMYVRPSSSNYADDYSNVPAKKQFADNLLSLPVPKFMEPILKKFTTTSLIHTPNVVVTPSAAGFKLHTHAGRFFPVNMFFKIHDFVAEMNPRTNPSLASALLFGQTVATINGFVLCIANFFGAIRSATFDPTSGTQATRAYNSYQSVLRQAFDSAINPVLSRDYTRRSTLAPLNIVSPTLPSSRFNPYDLLFGYSAANVKEMRIIFDSVASVINGAIPVSGDLASMFKDASGKSILVHGYSTFALPTWHHIQLHANARDQSTDNEAFDRRNPAETRQTPEDTAAALLFMVTPDQDAAAHGNAFAPATAVCDTTPAHPVTVTQAVVPLMVLSDNDIADPPVRNPTENEFVLFSEERDASPICNVLEPVEDDIDAAYSATCFGMIIESNMIDGHAIPMPNPELNLATQNARYADSALHSSAIIRATTFDAVTRHYVRRRTTERRNMARTATILIDISRIVVPRPLRHTIDNFVNNGFPGLSFAQNVNWIRATTQFLGFRLEAPGQSAHAERNPANTANALVHAWSPYTVTPNPADFVNSTGRYGNLLGHQTTYMIMNLRTIFGTDPQLIETQHAFDCAIIA